MILVQLFCYKLAQTDHVGQYLFRKLEECWIHRTQWTDLLCSYCPRSLEPQKRNYQNRVWKESHHYFYATSISHNSQNFPSEKIPQIMREFCQAYKGSLLVHISSKLNLKIENKEGDEYLKQRFSVFSRIANKQNRRLKIANFKGCLYLKSFFALWFFLFHFSYLNWQMLSLSLFTVSWQDPTVLYVDGYPVLWK